MLLPNRSIVKRRLVTDTREPREPSLLGAERVWSAQNTFMANDDFVALPDGRRVCLVTHGNPQGQPVFLLHGTPGSRLGHEFADQPAKDRGIRVLCPDRPGIGRSDPKPGRTIVSYATDIREVALALGIHHYGVVGYSGGGPYALACGAGTPDNVVAIAGMAGVGPVDGPRAFDGLAKTDLRFLKLARQQPWLGRMLMRVLVTGTRLSPKAAIKTLGRELSAVDGHAIREEDPRTLMASFIEASRQGPAGPLEDYRLLGSDWGFGLADIGLPVHLWQGDADQAVPLHHAEWMATQLPNATVHRLAGEGHMSIQRHVGDILSSAAGRLRGARP